VNPTLTIDVHLAPDAKRTAIETDARTGLTAEPKSLPPVWFYDETGSRLFDEITRLPEYYLTRAERAILEAHADEIVAVTGADTMVELGSGTSEKTRLLLDAMSRSGALQRFIPFDVSEEVLCEASEDISTAYDVDVHAVVGDFHKHLGDIPSDGRRLVLFLGSTIGNFTSEGRKRFLGDLDATMSFQDRLLLGTDLVKDPAKLVAAYDDAQGVTAAFNRNVLHVLNAELHADFDPEMFEHHAVWNEDEQWIEMRLRSWADQVVHVADLDLDVAFAKGEDLLTEISSKFTPERVEAELWDAGFVVEKTWTNPEGEFQLTLARPYC
jgi:L-histidine N-alpha-methyltransferase